MKYNGKIGKCRNSVLGINRTGNHFVYIKKTRNRNKYDVHTITSIENTERTNDHTIPIVIDTRGNIRYLDEKKLKALRNGNLYSIPKFDSNFPRWSGITKTPIRNIDESNIRLTNYKIKKRHKFMVGKIF